MKRLNPALPCVVPEPIWQAATHLLYRRRAYHTRAVPYIALIARHPETAIGQTEL